MRRGAQRSSLIEWKPPCVRLRAKLWPDTIADMDASTRRRREYACIKNQQYAAEAYEVAASGLDVAFVASEGGKQSWLSTACNAQETAALEAQSARDRLLSLVETGSNGASPSGERGEWASDHAHRPRQGDKADGQPMDEELRRVDRWIQAIARLARIRVRK